LDGVKNVNVDLETGKVNVECDSSKVGHEQMKKAVEDQSFDVA